MSRMKYLFQPIKVGNLELKNRLVMSSMALGYREKDGRHSLRLTKFLTERAKAGGMGLMFTSFCPFSHSLELAPGIYSDEFIPSLRKLTDAIHKYGVPIFAQMDTLYQWAKDKDTPLEYVSPSAIASRPGVPPTRPLTKDEIHQIVEDFGEGVRRARDAGFDGAEIQSGIGTIVSRFLSPFFNKREDEYGGSFENRMRMLLEIIKCARQKAGAGFPLSVRYSADELLEGGFDLEGGKEIAMALEKAGVDLLNLQVGLHDTPIPTVQVQCPEGKWVYMAEAIKKAVNIPVVTGFQIGSPVMAEEIIAKGKADLVGMARPFISDPEFGLKTKEGRLDDICYCTRCCRCMDQCAAREVPLDICSVNPRIGADLDSDIEPAAKPKKVLVVGGGPAGMEAARIATMRGHTVSLYERNPRLGGLMLFGSIVSPHIEKPIKYLTGEIERLGVKVELGKEVSPELVKELKPDVVILAVGGSPPRLDIPGINGENVITSHDMAELLGGSPPKKLGGKLASFALKYLYKPSRLRSLLKYNFPFGKKVIVLGGGFGGVELGDALAERGKEVTIIEESGRIGVDIGPVSRFVYMTRLRDFGAKTMTSAKVAEVNSQSVKGAAVSKEGASQPFEIEANTVAIARDLEANKTLVHQLEGTGPAVFLIGDATERQQALPPAIWGKVEPRRIGEAIKAGYRTAVTL